MSYRLSKIYTRKGDDGTTSLDAHQRISKDSIRIESLGTLDELNSVIGMILASNEVTMPVKTVLTQIQQDLFNLGGELCPPHREVITANKVSELEKILDEWNASLPPLKEFILPGGNLASATCHLARTVCRRAERCLVTLKQDEPFNPEILRYINRLSDVLFVAARILAKESHSKEILWNHERKK
ncbi:MAG: cob(I)yrinic acid a,c-diamide adenosyltransferase [Gammaproteobacteria bacterium]